MRKLVRSIGFFFVRIFGSSMSDAQSGERLGKAIIIPWGGKIHVIGLRGGVLPSFLPQKRLTYWKQEIGFTTHAAPNFPSVRNTQSEQKEKG